MSQRGFTLVELLIALALGVVVLLGLGTLYRTVAWSEKGDSAQAYLQTQATIVVDELARQVEAASTIERCFPGSDCLADTCNGVTDFLYVAQPDGSIYCFYKAGGQLMEYRDPVGAGSPGAWNLLSGSLAPLIVTQFNLDDTTSSIANVSFQLQAVDVLGGSSAAPTMTFTVAIAKRN